MSANWLDGLRRPFGRGVFPHQMAFFLDLPWRRLVLPPEVLADRLHLSPHMRVLEVGAGSGYYSVEVARRLAGGHLDLLDLQPGMLERARRRLGRAGLTNVSYHVGDGERLPFSDRLFDVVYLVTVLGEIGTPNAFLTEAWRVLRPGGTLSVSEHVPDPDFLSVGSVRRLAEGAGFGFVMDYGRPWSHTVTSRKMNDG